MFDMLSAEGVAVDGFVDDSPRFQTLNGVPVSTPSPSLIGGRRVVLAMLNGAARKRAWEATCLWGGRCVAFVSRHAFISPTATVEEGATILPFAQVMSNSMVGVCCHIHHFCVIGHDARIGKFTSMAPHCCIGGGTVIEDECVLGQGVVSCPGVRIGQRAMIGAATYIGGHVLPSSRVICPTSPTFPPRF
jgi:NDP-sugar pyrophosphorylase family protein